MNMEIQINDESVNLQQAPPTVKAALDFLVRIPDGKMYTTNKFCELAKIKIGSFRQHTMDRLLLPYKKRIGQRCLWGNEKTIKIYDEQLRHNG